MFCGRAFYGDCTVDVADQYQFVITKVLPKSLVGPAVHQLLPGDLIKKFIWVIDDEGQLDVFCDKAPLFDLRVPVLHHAGLGVNPQGVHKMCCITLHVEVVLLP